MQIIPADLPAGGERFHGTLSVEIERLGVADEVRAACPVSFDVRAARAGGGVRVSGSLSAQLEVGCVRCLAAFPFDIEQEFEVSYRRAVADGGDLDAELDESDLDLDYYGDEGIDLQQLLGEQLLLSLPMKPLCQKDCKGLCSQCGINLNNKTCDCKPEVDPRLASLGTLRDQLLTETTTKD